VGEPVRPAVELAVAQVLVAERDGERVRGPRGLALEQPRQGVGGVEARRGRAEPLQAGALGVLEHG
jgi:hypothetical protein